MENMCEHRYEITFKFADVGYGADKDQAIKDCLDTLVSETPIHYLATWLVVDKVEKDTANYFESCYLCEEEE